MEWRNCLFSVEQTDIWDVELHLECGDEDNLAGMVMAPRHERDRPDWTGIDQHAGCTNTWLMLNLSIATSADWYFYCVEQIVISCCLTWCLEYSLKPVCLSDAGYARTVPPVSGEPEMTWSQSGHLTPALIPATSPTVFSSIKSAPAHTLSSVGEKHSRLVQLEAQFSSI